MKFDVVVVGASIAGLHAARRLARSGKSVAVFDRQAELNPARRTLIVTPELRRVLPDIPEEAVLHQTGRIKLSSPNATGEVSLRDPDLIVERAAIIRWLFREAVDAGVTMHLGHRFLGFEPASARHNGNGLRNHLAVCFHNHGASTVRARQAVIGADGIHSDVGEAAGMPRVQSVPIVQAEVDLPPDWDPDVTQVWFNPDETRFFYWLIPESSSRGVVGLIGDDGVRTRALLGHFLETRGFRARSYQGARVALHPRRMKPWTELGGLPVLLVGDAAGQVKITTVGGMVTGVAAAEAAVKSILNGRSYAEELAPTRNELDVHYLIRSLLDRLDGDGYDLLVGALGPKLGSFLGRHDRDSMRGAFWRIPFVEPRLFRVAWRCLLGRGWNQVRREVSDPSLSA